MGPPPWAPTPPDCWPHPKEPRTCPEGSYQPYGCTDYCRNFNTNEGYYSQHFLEGPKYEYCLKSDFKCSKSKTLPRNLGSSVESKTKVFPHRSVYFYGIDEEPRRSTKTILVKADIEAPR